MAWITGSIYLWTTSLALILLSYVYKKKVLVLSGKSFRFNILHFLFLFSFSFLIGTSSIQIFLAIIFIFSWWLFEIHKEKKLHSIPIKFAVSLSGLVFGLIILIIAPGNYVRLDLASDIHFISRSAQFIMYLGGSFFGGGSGNLGTSLWLGVIVIILSGSTKLFLKRISKSFIWMFASLATLLPIFLVIYFASPRTTFMAVIFILIASKTIGYHMYIENEKIIMGEIIPILVSLLIVVDGFVGWVANKSLSNEINERMKIISIAIKTGERDVIVPHLTTIPSRLSFMLNPDHDKNYLVSMANHYDLNSITQDKSTNPRTKNTLKMLKNEL